MTALTNTGLKSAQACSSARHRCWWRRCGSGDGAFVAAGSVVTHDVPADAMTFGRAEQVDKPGRAAAFRAEQGEGVDVRHRWRHRHGASGPALAGGAAAAGVSRLRQRRHRHPGRTTASSGGARRASWSTSPRRSAREPLPGTTGIGHTRWATHGAPTQRNAHPHGTPRVSVVHNGIIENHAELRGRAGGRGPGVRDRDRHRDRRAAGRPPPAPAAWTRCEAARAAFARLEGAYALAMVFAGHPDLMIGAQHGAPLAVGFGENAMYLGSDSLALAPMTRRIAYLHEGDWAVVSRDNVGDLRARRRPVNRPDPGHRPDRRRGRQGRLPPLHGKGAARAPGRDRPDARPHARPGRPRGDAAGTAVRLGPGPAHDDRRLRQRLLSPGWPGGTGWRSWRGCRPTSMSPASSATAPRRCRSAASGCWSARAARRRTRWPRCASCSRPGNTWSPC